MWPIGYKFEYESNYGCGTITGIIARLEQPSNYKVLTLDTYEELKDHTRYIINGERQILLSSYMIYSTNGAMYNLSEIEIENVREIRDRKLKDMGI